MKKIRLKLLLKHEDGVWHEVDSEDWVLQGNGTVTVCDRFGGFNEVPLKNCRIFFE